MKKIIVLFGLLFILSSHIFAVTYYVSFLKGNDENNGIKLKSPWGTLSKVNLTKFLPGDSILFKRGEIWRGQLIPNSGDSSGYIYYGCYGEPTSFKPLILGSVSWNIPENWVNSKGNIWTTATRKSNNNKDFDNPLKVDVGNIIFNGGEICGVKVWNEATLDTQGKFWYDKDQMVVKLYSVGNPANYYKKIEFALKRHIIDESGKSYIKYENLDLRYGAAHGIGGGSVHHIIILNCDISFIGGALQLTRPNGDPVRYGNGIEFWNGAHDCYVINCKISDIYDAALTNQGTDNVSQYNIFYWNNIIWKSEYSFEYWLGNNSKTSHVYFENNTCAYAGNGWGHNQRPDGHNGSHLMFYGNKSKLDNFYIRNNIFSESTESSMRFGARWDDLANLTMDHNLYFGSSGKLADWLGTSYSLQEFKDFRKASGKDNSSIFADPCFVNITKFDFRLQSNSPAINKGTDTGNFQNSLRKVQKWGSEYDIGAIGFSNK